MSEQQDKTSELKDLFRKYLRNEIDEQDRDTIDTWYDSLDHLQNERHELSALQSSTETQAGILQVVMEHTQQSKRKWYRLSVVKVAASLFLIAGLLFFYTQNQTSLKEQLPQFFSTNARSTKLLTLSDGSTILLNRSSTLQVSGDFNRKHRKVSLIGEAFFTIAKNKSKPFIIQSANLKTTVVGTSFNISAYPDVSEIKIAVASGKVEVARSGLNQSDVSLASSMIQNDILVFDKKTQLAHLKTGDTQLLSAWSNQQLYIDDIAIDGIATQLSRHYGIKVYLDPSIKDSGKYTIMLGKEAIKGSIEILTELTHHNFYLKQNQLYIMAQK